MVMVERLKVPPTWAAAIRQLGTSKQALLKSRQALDIMADPLDSQSYEKLRRITLFCQMRNKGGGGKCTRREYVKLSLDGTLDERLKKLKII
jgi:hypothetical protein